MCKKVVLGIAYLPWLHQALVLDFVCAHRCASRYEKLLLGLLGHSLELVESGVQSRNQDAVRRLHALCHFVRRFANGLHPPVRLLPLLPKLILALVEEPLLRDAMMLDLGERYVSTCSWHMNSGVNLRAGLLRAHALSLRGAACCGLPPPPGRLSSPGLGA